MSDADATDCLADWCATEPWCGVTCAMDAIGRKWEPVIIHRLLQRGPLGFGDLADELDDVTNAVLSDSLADLVDKDLVSRAVVDDRPVRVSYSLTERGRSMAPVIEALAEWGETHAREPNC